MILAICNIQNLKFSLPIKTFFGSIICILQPLTDCHHITRKRVTSGAKKTLYESYICLLLATISSSVQ